MKKWLTILIASAVILYLIPLIAIFFLQRSFMYFPPDIYVSPREAGSAAIEIEMSEGEGARTTSWWIKPQAGKPVVMFFHGNGSAVYSNARRYDDLAAQGYGVWGAGYAGYPMRGGAVGKPAQAAIVNAVEQQYDWLIESGIAPQDIIFYGTSLGSGIAAQLSVRREPALLILEAPFNSTLDIGRQSMPVFPIGLLMKDTFRSDLALRGSQVLMVWLHGTEDNIIPLAQGQKLYDSYTGPKSHLIVEGGQHTDLWWQGGREFVFAALAGR